jgi:hypothetical protein
MHLTLESLTFLLAMIGYAGLAASTVAATAGARIAPRLTRATGAVVCAHVLMVWFVRYHWRIDLATRNGFGGFAIFHIALIFIVLASFVSQRTARVLLWIAFPVVTLGATAAVFSEAVVAVYRIPVFAVAGLGLAGLVLVRRNIGRTIASERTT